MKTQAWRLAIFHSLPARMGAELKIHGLLAALVIPKGETYKENPSLPAYKSKLLKPSGMKKP
jgi:hypothetical protein